MAIALPQRLGAVVFFPDRSRRPIYMYGRVAPDVLQVLATRDAFIYTLEACAQLLPLVACAKWLSGPIFAFCDNPAAQHALLKGYTNHSGVGVVTSCYWAIAAIRKLNPWFERVSSASNISDGVSRHEFELATKLDWCQVSVDFTQVFKLLVDHIQNPYKSTMQVAGWMIRSIDLVLPAYSRSRVRKTGQ